MSSAPKSASVPEPIVSDVRKPSLCLPDAWLRFFDDLRLVAVLVACQTSMSERRIVERTRLDRKTVRKKKRELIERYGVLCRDSQPARGRTDVCRIDWDRLKALTGFPQVGEKGTSSADAVEEKGTTSTAEVGEKGTTSAAEVGEKGTTSADAYKERAPAPAFESNPKSNKEQSIEDLRTAQKGDYAPDDFETARARLHSFQFANSRRAENRIANPPDETITAQILAICGTIEGLEDMLRTLKADRAEAGYKWVWFVRVALDRMRGLQFDDAEWKQFAAEVWPKRNAAPERKPPEKEEIASFDLHAQVKAAVAGRFR